MRVGDVVAAVEGFAPASVQESWDNSGLIIGSPADEVHGVLVGFDCTAALVEKARQAGCDMIVTHHPLIFKGIRRITPEDPVGEAVMLAIRYGIAAGWAFRIPAAWTRRARRPRKGRPAWASSETCPKRCPANRPWTMSRRVFR